MIKEKYTVETEVIASDDKMHTFEIKREWNEKGKKALIIELYPTISADHIGELDLSTMHLMNHVNELGWGSVRIINMYSTVFNGKPLAGSLEMDEENMKYIEDILKNAETTKYDIVIAWGSSLSTHIKTIKTKANILSLIKENHLEGCVKALYPEFIEEDLQAGTHPLYLGLHHAKETWSLKSFPVEQVLQELNGVLGIKAEKSAKKNTKAKGGNDNVSKTKK